MRAHNRHSRNARLLWPLLMLLLPAVLGCEIGYAVRQGWHQARLLARERAVQEVLDDPSVHKTIKEGILLVQEVRDFGQSHLGLSPSANYRSFIDVEGEVVAFTVSASKKDCLEPYLWRFPLLGAFPYKGFFDRRDAVEEEMTLRGLGYDTHLSGVVAFSALGWFPDPLYSSMLRMPRMDLIYTVLHEMVHGTVFFKHRVDFNERLATFVGWKGALSFMENKYGRHSPEAKEALEVIEDEKRLAEFLQRAKGRLSSFYALPITSEAKIEGREEVFREIQEEARRLLPGMKTRRFVDLDRMIWNNASLMALWRYSYDVGDLDSAYDRAGGDLKALLARAKEWMDLGIDPEEALRKELRGGQ
ncbi:MAG: aminopeptidase [Thermodesulfobacteriota bacterium]